KGNQYHTIAKTEAKHLSIDKCFAYVFLSCHGIPETENEEIVINDKQVDNMNASKFQNNSIYFLIYSNVIMFRVFIHTYCKII
ncbi:hypothetical protein PDQ07_28095, partial [Bacillus cereus]|nr:hypothetical protein [Bacillus cereus]